MQWTEEHIFLLASKHWKKKWRTELLQLWFYTLNGQLKRSFIWLIMGANRMVLIRTLNCESSSEFYMFCVLFFKFFYIVSMLMLWLMLHKQCALALPHWGLYHYSTVGSPVKFVHCSLKWAPVSVHTVRCWQDCLHACDTWGAPNIRQALLFLAKQYPGPTVYSGMVPLQLVFTWRSFGNVSEVWGKNLCMHVISTTNCVLENQTQCLWCGWWKLYWLSLFMESAQKCEHFMLPCKHTQTLKHEQNLLWIIDIHL